MGRKKNSTNKQNARLRWDIAEAQLQKMKEKPVNNATHTAPCFQLLIMVAIIITAILEQIAVYVREILKITKKTGQAVKSMTTTTATSKTSCKTVSINFTQRLNKETETPEHKTLNSALVPMNKVLNITWKSSEDHALHIHNAAIHQDSKTSLFQGSKQEDHHTRKTLGTLSWVYKPGNNPIVFGASIPCWSYWSQDLRPTKTVGIKTHIAVPK